MPLKDAAATLLESLSENLSGEAINRREETAKTSTGDLPENEETAEVPADNLPESVDEPATAVVMKRYADRIRELIPLASDEVAAQARALVKRCDELYDQANAFAEELSNIYEDDDIDVEGLQARMMQLNALMRQLTISRMLLYLVNLNLLSLPSAPENYHLNTLAICETTFTFSAW